MKHMYRLRQRKMHMGVDTYVFMCETFHSEWVPGTVAHPESLTNPRGAGPMWYVPVSEFIGRTT